MPANLENLHKELSSLISTIETQLDDLYGYPHNLMMLKRSLSQIARGQFDRKESILGKTQRFTLPERSGKFVTAQYIQDHRQIQFSCDRLIWQDRSTIKSRGAVVVDRCPLRVMSSFKTINDELVKSKPMTLDMVFGLIDLKDDKNHACLRQNGWGNLIPKVVVGKSIFSLYVQKISRNHWEIQVDSPSNDKIELCEKRYVYFLNTY